MMWQALTNLIKVKTLVTLALTGVFAYLSIIGKSDAEQFMTVFSVVTAFYFGTQYEKKTQAEADTTKETE